VKFIPSQLLYFFQSAGARRNVTRLLLLLLDEKLEVFRAPVHPSLIDLTLRENRIRELTGCSVVATNSGDQRSLNPDPSARLREGDELILIGTGEAEESFVRRFPKTA
jgi:K+/H+ antiporter YhaU regulatory subunit KhtT